MAGGHDTTVLIAGGGIGGLTTALALRHYGIDATVFEQADDLRKTQMGSGLSLGFNVSRAFKHLGLLIQQRQVFETRETEAAFDSELALLWWDPYALSRWQINPMYTKVANAKLPPIMMVEDTLALAHTMRW